MGVRPPPQLGEVVVVVTVQSVENPDATNGNPPRVVVQVDQVLRGQVPPGPLLTVWQPWAEGSFYAMRNGPDDLTRWYQDPLVPPGVGERHIITGQMVVPQPVPPGSPTGLPGGAPVLDRPYLAVADLPRHGYSPESLALVKGQLGLS